MRTILFAGLVLLTALAGCTGRSLDCPDEYGPQFEETYRTVADRLDEAGNPIPDADYDCISDPLEAQFGTDPEDPASYPSLEQIAEGAQDLPGLGNSSSEPPAPTLVWKAGTIEGEFTTTLLYDLTAAGRTFSVPADAQRLWLNLTTSGDLPGGLNVRFIPAGCESNDCYLEESAPGGSLQYESDELASGEWRLVVFSDTAAQKGTFQLEFNALVPVAEVAATQA